MPPGDVTELAEKILRALNHPEELARLSRQVKKESRQYSVDSYVNRLQDWYVELANQRSSGAN